MPPKKHIIIIGVLCVIALGLGYWVGLPKEGSGGGGGNGDPKDPEFLKQGLVAYYPFNGNAKDESGNGNDGKVNGTTLVEDRTSKPSSAYGFDGVDDFIGLPPLEFSFHSFTIALWFRPVEAIGGQRVFDMKAARSDGKAAAIVYNVEGNGLVTYIVHGGPNVTGTKQLDKNKYNHITILHNSNRESGEVPSVATYINGEPDSTGETLYLNAPSIGVRIGARIDGDRSDAKKTNGSLDDIRIYNRALSEAEVKELYEFEKAN